MEPLVECFPSRLQSLLGSEYDVLNFGKSGMTILKKLRSSYWDTEEFADAKVSEPNIVFIYLGTNDIAQHKLPHFENLKEEATELVNVFKYLPTKPRIIMVLPEVICERFFGNISDMKSGLEKVVNILIEVAKETQSDIISLKSLYEKEPNLLPDCVHPNADGASKIAKTLYDFLVQEKLVL